jgi:steroid 5-alpha reductase family enzyme
MPEQGEHRRRALAWCVVAYVAALLAAGGSFAALHSRSPIAQGAVADLVATGVIFAFSVLFNNSSMYDPYWSVAPVPLFVAWALPVLDEVGRWRILLIGMLLLAWSVRLTWNWARGWRGLAHEDWRYVQLRQTTGRWYWPVSLLGLHLMPTVFVFLGSLSLYEAAVSTRAFGFPDAIAATVAALAIGIEATADEQLRAFVQSRPPPGSLLTSGLWAWSRHPNYFGEVLFWWGMWLFGAAAGAPPWTLVGPLAMTCLFWFISIPLMEKRMVASRPGYVERQRQVSRLVPWFSRARGTSKGRSSD